VSFNETKQLYLQKVSQSVPPKHPGVSYAVACKSCCSASSQTDLTWPIDSKVLVALNITISSPFHHAETNTDDIASNGAAGGKPATQSNNSNMRQRKTCTPKTEIQPSNAKPGPAFSKQPSYGKKKII
jgi:hypothetical protein